MNRAWPFKTLSVDRSGNIAVEFALILPILITCFIGVCDIVLAIDTYRKFSKSTAAAGDLMSRELVASSAIANNIMDSAEIVITPAPAASLGLVLTGIAVDNSGSGAIEWSFGRRGAAQTAGTAASLPSGVAIPNSFVVMVEGSYNFQFMLGQFAGASIPFSKTFYFQARETRHMPQASLRQIPDLEAGTTNALS